MKLKKINLNEKVSTIFKYSAIKYIALIIGFLKGIINARILGPELLGIIGNLLLVLSYLSYSNFGIITSMNREYILYKDKDEEKATKVLNTAFSFLIVLSALLIISGIIIKLFIYKNEFGTYLFLIFIIAIFEQFKGYFVNYYRLFDNYRNINYIELISNVLIFILICIFISNFKINAVLYSMLIADIVIFIYSILKANKINISIDKKILKDLFIVGIPLLIYNLGYYMLTTVDRVMIIKLLNYEDLGYYTFANQIVGATIVFLESILFLYYPKAIKNLNIEQGGDKKLIYVNSQRYTKYIETLGILLCSTGYVLMYPFVKLILSGYDSSINIYRILVLAMTAYEIVYFANVFIVSNKKQIYLIILHVIMIFSAIAFNYIFIKLGYGIIGIALAALITNFIYALLQYIIYLKLMKIDGWKIIEFIKIYHKFIIYSFVLLLITMLDINIWINSIVIISVTGGLYYKDIKSLISDFCQ